MPDLALKAKEWRLGGGLNQTTTLPRRTTGTPTSSPGQHQPAATGQRPQILTPTCEPYPVRELNSHTHSFVECRFACLRNGVDLPPYVGGDAAAGSAGRD